jgi:hypothetical protein
MKGAMMLVFTNGAPTNDQVARSVDEYRLNCCDKSWNTLLPSPIQ